MRPLDEDEREGVAAARSGQAGLTSPHSSRDRPAIGSVFEAQEPVRRYDAWQRGHECGEGWSSKVKESLPSPVLVEVIVHRLRAIPSVRDKIRLDPRCLLSVDRPHPHVRDARGRSWNVHGFRCGDLPTWEVHTEFRHVVDGVRDAFDLD